MLILIGILPGIYAVNLDLAPARLEHLATMAENMSTHMESTSEVSWLSPEQATKELSSFLKKSGDPTDQTFAAIALKCRDIAAAVKGKTSLKELQPKERRSLRSDLYLTSEALGKLNRMNKLTDESAKAVADLKKSIDEVTKFIPKWVKVTVAIVLGLGTMIGWKRIVVTVGEKIGKEHLTYAQGAAAELVAAGTILAADRYGLPVSTTHVLSSGVAGTMAANRSGLQASTVRNLLLAWVLTLPVTVLLGATIFAFVLNILLHYGLA